MRKIRDGTAGGWMYGFGFILYIESVAYCPTICIVHNKCVDMNASLPNGAVIRAMYIDLAFGGWEDRKANWLFVDCKAGRGWFVYVDSNIQMTRREQPHYSTRTYFDIAISLYFHNPYSDRGVHLYVVEIEILVDQFDFSTGTFNTVSRGTILWTLYFVDSRI